MSVIVWFEGRPGAGKTTIATRLKEQLSRRFPLGFVLLDGDRFRRGLCRELQFSYYDRTENLRRAGEVAKMLAEQEYVPIGAFITPFARQRIMLRKILEAHKFIEIYVSCPYDVCASRKYDLYKSASEGRRKDFTGLSSDFNEPTDYQIKIDTHLYSLDECYDRVYRFVRDQIDHHLELENV